MDKRLRELGIYSDYYLRKELKPLAELLQEGERLNCILTGVHEAERKMLAITDRRILLIFCGALVAGEVKVLRRDAVERYEFNKKFLFSSLQIVLKDGSSYVLTNTQGSMRDFFEWAMKQPLPPG
ncbi:MAG: hypothetical protein IK095_03075 [Oscillospiraceae bacterium]|nr:hypothetical protein [Oscillospiraceae bacterium]